MATVSRRRSKGPTPRKRWQRMERGTPNPALIKLLVESGEPIGAGLEIQAWANDLYQAVVRVYEATGLVHLSIKKHDRSPVRDWRHLQSIKNEVCGPEREACEIFPAESRLTDAANEYHLWVLPEGESFPFGWAERQVASPEEVEHYNREVHPEGKGKAKQRPWQEGLSTGAAVPCECDTAGVPGPSNIHADDCPNYR